MIPCHHCWQRLSSHQGRRESRLLAGSCSKPCDFRCAMHGSCSSSERPPGRADVLSLYLRTSIPYFDFKFSPVAQFCTSSLLPGVQHLPRQNYTVSIASRPEGGINSLCRDARQFSHGSQLDLKLCDPLLELMLARHKAFSPSSPILEVQGCNLS